MQERHSLDISVFDEAPEDPVITLYDERHFLTYARLLDAETDGSDWREAAQAILHCDVNADAERALRCWETHLARAHWVITAGVALTTE